MKALIATIPALLLALVCVTSQDTFAQEQKQIPKSDNEPLLKLQEYKNKHGKPQVTKEGSFANKIGWFFSIILPEGWVDRGESPFYFANAQTDANQILVDRYVPDKQSFAWRDDFHWYLKSTEYLANGEFGLGNSITTMDTDYGYKTVIVLKHMGQNGNPMMMRKDFHFVRESSEMYVVYGYSYDVDSFASLKRTLDTFTPLT
jgi:hypothetical protein